MSDNDICRLILQSILHCTDHEMRLTYAEKVLLYQKVHSVIGIILF